MSSLVEIRSLSKSYGSQDLFDSISFTLSKGERVGLLGPNGAGKSTLLKIIMGLEPADNGSVFRRKETRIGYASQLPEFEPLTVEEIALYDVEHTEEARTRARILLGKAQFTDLSQNALTLSGGWKKRLDIVRALTTEPDLLLLDEPTNHLDLEGIQWLETFLLKERLSYFIVSHDRYFLEKIGTKIIELNPCYPEGLFISQGNISLFQQRKELFLQAQIEQAKSLASTVRAENAWLKKTPQARTTKSRSRIKKALELQEELSCLKQRNKTSRVSISFSASERETKKLLVAKNLSKTLGDKSLFCHLDCTLSPGTRLGVVGGNGTGKTSLLKILAGELSADMGTVKYAPDLKLVYFDQHREKIPDTISLKEALSPNGDTVIFRGQPIHVNGWAKRFLFSPDKLQLPVHCLSGGERARILIAKLMLKDADILFLDEPTNDLDIPTLEVIEQSLQEFAGAVVLISHDRWFMDTICTDIIGLGADNEDQLFASYEQWERSHKSTTPPTKKEKTAKKPSTLKKLSYKEQKELETLEPRLAQAEKKVSELLEKTNQTPSLELYEELGKAQKEVETLFERWHYLTEKTSQE